MKRFAALLFSVFFLVLSACENNKLPSDYFLLLNKGSWHNEGLIFYYSFSKGYPGWIEDLTKEEEVTSVVCEGYVAFKLEYDFYFNRDFDLIKQYDRLVLYNWHGTRDGIGVILLDFWHRHEEDIPETLEITLTRTDKGEEITEQYTLDFTQKPKFN